MRPTLRSASPRKPLPKRQATGRPWTEKMDITCRFLWVFDAVSSVGDAEQCKGSPTLCLPNPTSAFPLVDRFATKLRAQLARGRDGLCLGGGVSGGHPPSRENLDASGIIQCIWARVVT